MVKYRFTSKLTNNDKPNLDKCVKSDATTTITFNHYKIQA